MGVSDGDPNGEQVFPNSDDSTDDIRDVFQSSPRRAQLFVRHEQKKSVYE